MQPLPQLGTHERDFPSAFTHSLLRRRKTKRHLLLGKLAYLSILDDAHSQMARQGEVEKNKTSVRIELLADYYAGVWGYHENKMFGSLEDGDLQEAIDAAQKIGDDYLQKRARGSVSPESFTHGTSAQRMKWLKKGLQTGDIRGGNTFDVNYNSL